MSCFDKCNENAYKGMKICSFHDLLFKYRGDLSNFEIRSLTEGFSSEQLNFLSEDERPVEKMIFCGSGIFSVIETRKLHKKLDDAFSWLSGSQQPSHYEFIGSVEQDEKDQIQAKNEIVKILKEIALSLGISAEDLK
jgi:hypothetical protein